MTKAKKPDYERAFFILNQYWDYLPEEDKKEIDKALKECGI